MKLRYRPIGRSDIDRCAELIARHPVIGPRYAGTITQLRAAWNGLLGREAMTHCVFEEVGKAHVELWGFGVGVMVTDDFIREIKSPPLSWFGPKLARRVLAKDSPVLSDKQVREKNSNGGLNLLVWESCVFSRRRELYHFMMTGFLELHRGFRWKEAITSQAESAERLQWVIDSGGLLWNPDEQRYVRTMSKDPATIFTSPHIVGVTRELEMGRPSSWVGALFSYREPEILFSRSEQRLLLAAISHATDEELARYLGKSSHTIKATWRSIYNRAALRLPELFADDSHLNPGSSERGKEKRRRLLAYLRDHPEELRPFSASALRRSRKPVARARAL